MKDLHDQFLHLLSDEQEIANLRRTLAQVPVFSTLAPEELLAIVHVGRMVAYEPRELVFEQDSPTTDLHVVLEGVVQLVQIMPSKQGKVMADRGAGTSFGEAAFLTRAKRNLRAMVGDKECLQLVIPRDRFEELLQKSPSIGSKVYAGIVDGVYSRLEQLPAYFRNFVLWGYSPQGMLFEKAVQPPRMSKSLVYPLAGAAGGPLALWAFKMLGENSLPFGARQVFDDFYEPGLSILAVILGVVGLLIGVTIDQIDGFLSRRRQDTRSCINCQFVMWSEGSASFSCAYKERGLHHVSIKLGLRPDTYTDCESFSPAPRTGKTGEKTAPAAAPAS